MHDDPQPSEETESPSRKGAVKFFLLVLGAFGAILLWNKFGPEREFLLLYFVIAVLCLDLIYLVFLFSWKLPWPLRLFITSFTIAFIFAPTIIVGHGAAIVPAWLVLFARENGHYDLPVALRSGLLPIGVVCAAVMLIQSPFYYLCRKEKHPMPDRK
ncbi:MAG: hypothetical protein V4819_18245 [Verrucomicrobiota bacterium]